MKLTKKSVLTISIFGSGVCAYLLYGVITHLCYEQWAWCKNLWRPVNDIVLPILFLFPIMLIIQLVIWRAREEVSATWIKFLSWWVPLSIILILIAPKGKSMFFPSMKEFFGLLMPALFLIISLILIIKKLIQVRRQK